MAKAATTRVHIVLPDDVLEGVDKLVGPRGRSQFVAEATEELLQRKRLMKALEDLKDAPKDFGPPEWDTPEGTSAWVRSLREESDDRLGDWLPKPEPQT